MAIDEFITPDDIITVEPSAEHMRGVIQRRFDLIERLSMYESGQLFHVTDSAYNAIGTLTKNNVGLALEVTMRMLAQREQQGEKKLPHIFTEKDVVALGLTYEKLHTFYGSPLRSATIIDARQQQY